MFKKQLLQLVPQAGKYIAAAVGCNWLTLLANIVFVLTVSQTLQQLYLGLAPNLLRLALTLVCCLAVRSVCQYQAVQLASSCTLQVKQSLRRQIYEKLLRCSNSWQQKFSHAEIVQMATEGVEQLELYFSQYLPQLLYSLAATVTLFVVIAPRSVFTAVVLFLCIPLIPVSMMAVQKLARRMLNQYWGTYTDLGDVFLDNLQGLTTLKIYQADDRYHQKMNQQAERFRVITMKVLTMQLNSIIVMDVIAYGGSALAMLISLWQYSQGALSLLDALVIVLLAADFFIPLRLLGSLFHVTMNGLAAADKISAVLELPEDEGHAASAPSHFAIRLEDVTFHYPEESAPALQHISLHIGSTGITALAGQSGCGKSTLAALISRAYQPSSGQILLGDKPLSQYGADQLSDMICRIGFDNYLFAGSVAYNLRMAAPEASPEAMILALKQVALWDFLKEQQGLDTLLTAGGSNLSGGQRQRLAVARALLKDAPIYIFDEATSNIDAESEETILKVIGQLRHTKSIILISHRLSNITDADCIYVLQQGRLVQEGRHEKLMQQNGSYRSMFQQQQQLEQYGLKPQQDSMQEEASCHG